METVNGWNHMDTSRSDKGRSRRTNRKEADMRHNWEHNASTGNYILRVGPNTRVVRIQGGGLYRVEYWGDYSLRFPIRGPWRKTLRSALADRKAVEST